jgi:Tol biopolymer transport system component
MAASHRVLPDGQCAQIWIGGPGQNTPDLLFETDNILIEAPNWSLDGKFLFLNGHGLLWRLDIRSPGAGLVEVAFQNMPELNNDHVLDPDGGHIYMSANDGHIYRGALTGGWVERVTPEDDMWHFLHGVSPDGTRLAYVQISDIGNPGKLAVMEPHQPSVLVDTGGGHVDGPEWSPDSHWIYFNTESLSDRPGHAQLARMSDPPGPVEHLVASDTVDWFPHLSPDARWASYVSFPQGTTGHPADLDVVVKLVATSDWTTPVQSYPVFGGQGTINVNSWSPGSALLAFVAYPIR